MSMYPMSFELLDIDVPSSNCGCVSDFALTWRVNVCVTTGVMSSSKFAVFKLITFN